MKFIDIKETKKDNLPSQEITNILQSANPEEHHTEKPKSFKDYYTQTRNQKKDHVVTPAKFSLESLEIATDEILLVEKLTSKEKTKIKIICKVLEQHIKETEELILDK